MGPQKKNGGKHPNIFDFSGLWKHAKYGPKQAREFFLLLIQTLPTFCVRWILILRIVLGGKGWVPKSGRTISKPFRCPQRPGSRPGARPAQGPRPAQGSAQGPPQGLTHTRTKARPDLGTQENTQNENSQNHKYKFCMNLGFG